MSTDAPTTEAPKVEPATTETPAIAPEAAIVGKDSQVVEENLAKAEPVTNPGEATQETPAVTEETAAPTEEAGAAETPAAQTTEHKEGSTLLNFLKKHIPNPKDVSKKPASGKAVDQKDPEIASEAPETTTAEPVAAETADDTPFEGGDVEFKTHGGIFG
jgi:hypothetical protein